MSKSFSLGYLGISSLAIICAHYFFSVSLLPGLCVFVSLSLRIAGTPRKYVRAKNLELGWA